MYAATTLRDRWSALGRRGRLAIGVGGVALAAALGYGVDLLATAGDVPRGTIVAGVDIGGMSRAGASAALERELGPRATGEITLHAADVAIPTTAADLGLTPDWDATVDAAGSQPLNPFTRIGSWFVDRPVAPTGPHDDAVLTAALAGLRERIDRDAIEGGITFEGAEPQPVHPRDGLRLRVDDATPAIRQHWLDADGVRLPVDVSPTAVTADAVDRALAEIARPAASAPIEIATRDGHTGVIPPERIGDALTFVPDDRELRAEWSPDGVRAVAGPPLTPTERPARDATVRITAGSPEVVPAQDGSTIDWDAVAAALPAAAASTDGRRVEASHRDEKASYTTEMAEKAGVREVIGEFTTSGYSYTSGVNIRRVAEQVDQAFIPPGAEFSLNRHTGPRGAEQGYVPSGVIIGGRIGTAVGGGISQFATTLYNAAYFGGMELLDHTAHSFYISRYPAGREATVYEGAIDLRFRNAFDTAVVIETRFGGGQITVRLWGTKHVDVESVPGARHSYTAPPVRTMPAESCAPSGGSTGFTTSDTRIIREHGTDRELSRTTTTTVYQPEPAVRCAEPEPEPESEPGNGREEPRPRVRRR